MTATLSQEPTQAMDGGGGAPARRAVIRWAWRLFRREWRQQLLVLILILVAVAATTVGAGVATNTGPSNPGYGTTNHLVVIPGTAPDPAASIDSVRQNYGTVDVIEHQSVATGTVIGAELRAQDPHGPFGRPMLALTSGRYPAGPGEVALTKTLAATLHLRTGDVWHAAGGRDRTVVGTVENPQNLLDVFGLVPPGQLEKPDQITVLFYASRFGDADQFRTPDGAQAQQSHGVDGTGQTIILLVFAIVGLIFVGLVAVAGFTVQAQRRQRALGMLVSLGATDRNVRLVMIANGAFIGVLGAIAGAAIGLAVWAAVVPGFSSSVNYRVTGTDLPWWLIITTMLLAAATSTLAARRPARAIAEAPVLASLVGRPAPAKPVRRSVWLPIVLLAAAVGCLWFSGGWGKQQNVPLVVGGVVTASAGLLLLAPIVAGILGAVATGMPFATRVALRDLARYRSRSGPTLAASGFAVFIAVTITVLATGWFADPLSGVGPNLSDRQLVVNAPDHGRAEGAAPNSGAASQTRSPAADTVKAIGKALNTADILALDEADVALSTCTPGSCSTESGAIWVATPAVLSRFGIDPATIAPNTLLITSRHGMSDVHGLALTCHGCQPTPNPAVQVFDQLPSGSSAPNTLITPHAVDTLKISTRPAAAWLLQAPDPITAAQLDAAREAAFAAGMTVQGKDSAPSLDQIRTYSTVTGILLALGVLAMTIGLIRSETAGDLRTLTATGAPRRTRRTITAATAGSLGLLAAVLGTAVAYLAMAAYFHGELSLRMGHVPVRELLIILLGLPVAAALGGWLFAGREPRAIARQPLE